MRHIALAAAAALTAVTSIAGAQIPTRPGMPGEPWDLTPEDAPSYVSLAGASDLYEIQSSQIALQRSRLPQVRQFAQMIIRHHRRTTQDLIAGAKQARVNLRPPRLAPAQLDMLAQLRRTPRGNFDRLYLAQQVTAHESALDLHHNYARTGDTRALVTVARTTVPIIENHLSEAIRLSQRWGR